MKCFVFSSCKMLILLGTWPFFLLWISSVHTHRTSLFFPSSLFVSNFWCVKVYRFLAYLGLRFLYTGTVYTALLLVGLRTCCWCYGNLHTFVRYCLGKTIRERLSDPWTKASDSDYLSLPLRSGAMLHIMTWRQWHWTELGQFCFNVINIIMRQTALLSET